MSKKLKFKPEITRVKLDPEQAVLNCSCYDIGLQAVYTSQAQGPSGFTMSCTTNLYPRNHVSAVNSVCSTSTCGGGNTAYFMGGAATSS